MAGDFLMAFLALFFSLYFWSISDAYLDFSMEFVERTPIWYFTLPFFWLLLLSSLYQTYRVDHFNETLRGIAIAAVIGLGVYMVFYFVNEPKSLPRRGVAGFVAAAVLLTLVWRMVYIRIFTAPQFLRRILVVGGGETGQIILRIVREAVAQPFLLIGVIDDDPQKIGTSIEGFPVLGGSERLLELASEHQVTDLIVAISGKMRGSMFQALLDAQEQGIEITRMPVAYEELLSRVPIRYLEADWILRSFVDQARSSTSYDIIKRLIDIAGALAGAAVLLPLLPFIAFAIVIDSGFPVFYSQVRLGRGGNAYMMLKFRTMRQNAEPDGKPQWAEESDPRATRVGRFLRKTHLDELPQVWNILHGEMSLVGPRAERPELVAWFQDQVPFYRARLLVKPGLTGWAQVNQNYAATVDETITKLEYDLFYIKRRSLALDISVILRTPMMLFRGR
jgi:exopolysaccharide biosynthesis polyprenyl glycosylphosphotransferase